MCCRPSVGSSGSESRSHVPTASRVYRLGKHGLANLSPCADEDCRRLDGAVCVARPSVADYQKAKRSFSDSALQSVLCLKLLERQTKHLLFCSWSSLCSVLASKHQPRMARWRRYWVACNVADIAGEAP